MKKRLLFIATSLAIIFLAATYISAAQDSCSAAVKLVSQDPYPASPGEYVKLVFQIDGISNPSCGTIAFELKDKFPIKFDPESSNTYSVQAGFFQRTYGTFATVPFKVRVDESAVSGDNEIETTLNYMGSAGVVNNFSISIQNLKSDFDIYPKNYDLTTNILTLEFINIGKSNIKALTAAILPESEVTVKGPNKNILGDLDTSEYTTADFEISGKGKIKFKLEYTDETDVRRAAFSEITFDPSSFQGRKKDQKSVSIWSYIFFIAIISGIAFFIYKRYKKNKSR